jgi:hypothetical protein
VPGSPESVESPPFITRWDLDKTYLRTEFETMGDLVRTAFERPDQKRAVPGAATLLHLLGETGARVHILSGSPRQLRGKLEEKLRIDRVRWDELTLKPNLSNLLRLRLRALRDQLGYKLPVLLEARSRDQRLFAGNAPEEVLVGDDAEADAFVYSLYADACEGSVDEAHLGEILRRGRVYHDQAEGCLASFRRIRTGKAVARILIHLDRQSPPSTFDAYGPRVVPFYNYLQAAFVLAEDGRITGRAVLAVASVLVVRHRFDGEGLGRSYLDLMRRGHAAGSVLPALEDGLSALGAAPEEPGVLGALTEMTALIAGYLSSPPRVRPVRPAKPDYLELAERHQGGKNRKNFRSVTG